MGFLKKILITQDIQLLQRLSREIDEYFKVSYMRANARAADIYDFIKNRKLLRNEFPTSKDFSHFLRRTYKNGTLKVVISNSSVDISNPNYYQWYFYRKEQKLSHQVEAESFKSDLNYFRDQRKDRANNGDMTRSKQEQYIYNRLLNEKTFRVYYETSMKIKKEKKYPDFTIQNMETKTVYRWEHVGMAKNPEYAQKTASTIQWYINNGYKFIEQGGTLIVTYYNNKHEFRNDVEKFINLIKEK